MANDPANAKVQSLGSGDERGDALSRSVSFAAILTVVALIGTVQLANWVLGRSRTSDRLKIV